IAWLHIERVDDAFLVGRAWADGNNLALLRLPLRGIGNDDAAFGALVLLDTAYDHAVVQRTKFHDALLLGNYFRQLIALIAQGRSHCSPRPYLDPDNSTFKTRVLNVSRITRLLLKR